ncbi:hypothetical protein [Nannocystis pusilla]|uniref:hypothetical protein n=1 Tax=Nannocystis pusilla TaxID=889268 RepID=UPI003B7783BB
MDQAFLQLDRSDARLAKIWESTLALCAHAPELCGCYLTRIRNCYRCGGVDTATRRYLPVDILDLDPRPRVDTVVLQRVIPRRTTFAERRACFRDLEDRWNRRQLGLVRFNPRRAALRACWADAIGKRVGAYDELLAIAGGREHVLERMACDAPARHLRAGPLGMAIDDLLEQAQERGYWRRPEPLELVPSFPIALDPWGAA